MDCEDFNVQTNNSLLDTNYYRIGMFPQIMSKDSRTLEAGYTLGNGIGKHCFYLQKHGASNTVAEKGTFEWRD